MYKVINKLAKRYLHIVVFGLALLGIIMGLFFGINKGFVISSQHPLFNSPFLPEETFSAVGDNANGTKLITPSGIGDLTLGTSVEEIGSLVSPWWIDVFVTTKEGVLTESYVVNDKEGKKLFEIYPFCFSGGSCKVHGIKVFSSLLVTSQGVRVGSTYADMLTNHSVTKISHDESVFLVETESGLTYIIPDNYSKAKVGDPASMVNEITDNAVIQNILITKREHKNI